MFGLRQKLIIGFGGLLAMLLLMGALGLYLLHAFSRTVETTTDKSESCITIAQSIWHAVDSLEEPAHSALASTEPTTQVMAANAQDALAHVAPVFPPEIVPRRATSVVYASRDKRLIGEAQDLAAGWGDFASSSFALLHRPGLSSVQRNDVYAKDYEPTAALLRTKAQALIASSLNYISAEDGRIRRASRDARHTMYILLGAGMLLALALIGLFVRSILIPLRTLTQSAREIERGNLDLVVAVPLQDEVGQLAEAFNSMASKLREVRRSDRQKIVRAQRTTQLALDSLPDAVAIVSADGRIDLSNQTAQRLFRLRPGISLKDIDLPRLQQVYTDVVASGVEHHPRSFDAAIQMFDGEERFFLPHALPINDSDGQPFGVTLVLADITGLRRLDEMKSNLLAVVSHELKTPLTGLRMATHLLLDERTGALNPQQTEMALAARDDANRLHTIVEGLLDINRLQSGRQLLELAAEEPAHLVERAQAEVAAAYRDKGVALDLELPADLPAVLADPVRIDHVFANLVGNALKFTPSGGRVVIRAIAGNEIVEFQICDTGVGIPSEHRARIFERFYRVPGQAGAGAGLGLAIATEIVIAHGGVLWLVEQSGPGSTFAFTLPRAHPEAVVPTQGATT